LHQLCEPPFCNYQDLLLPILIGSSGWIVVALLACRVIDVNRAVGQLAIQVRLPDVPFDALKTTTLISAELEQRERAVAINFGESEISSSTELSSALLAIAQGVYGAVGAEAVEIALFDESSHHYHSGILFGRSIHAATQAMLVSASKEEVVSPFVVTQRMHFAGTFLGTLRVQLPTKSIPTPRDREMIALFALHGCVALLNARFTEDLQAMRAFSDEGVRARTGFLANLSHELRGPLGLMLNGVELVRDELCGEINDEQKKLLDIVLSSSSHLLDLMNDVLDYAKAECGRSEPRPESLSLKKLLPELGAVVRPQAEAKGHKLIVQDITDELPVFCDKRHLRQVLINLLTNAVKYTKEGGQIVLDACAEPQGRVRISVTDTGVGIPKEDRDKVFRAFERLEDSYAKLQVGTGLGLSLTKKLVLLNGGIIDFVSSCGKGSTFWIILPRGDDRISYQVEEQLSKQSPNIIHHGSEIAFVGDADSNSEMVALYLNSIGFSLRVYGRETFSLKRIPKWQADPQIVLVDESAGEDIAELLAREYSGRAVLYLTSDAFAVAIERSLRIGVERCLVKPVNLQMLACICDEAIGRFNPT
jgi:signal transduction histidine kinase